VEFFRLKWLILLEFDKERSAPLLGAEVTVLVAPVYELTIFLFGRASAPLRPIQTPILAIKFRSSKKVWLQGSPKAGHQWQRPPALKKVQVISFV